MSALTHTHLQVRLFDRSKIVLRNHLLFNKPKGIFLSAPTTLTVPLPKTATASISLVLFHRGMLVKTLFDFDARTTHNGLKFESSDAAVNINFWRDNDVLIGATVSNDLIWEVLDGAREILPNQRTAKFNFNKDL